MTKAQYMEMCEAMNLEPDPEQIPPEYEDFHTETHDAFEIFEMLPDRWDGMSGTYLGKDLSVLDLCFNLLQIEKEEQLLIFRILLRIQNININIVNNKIAAKAKKGSKNNGNSS